MLFVFWVYSAFFPPTCNISLKTSLQNAYKYLKLAYSDVTEVSNSTTCQKETTVMQLALYCCLWRIYFTFIFLIQLPATVKFYTDKTAEFGYWIIPRKLSSLLHIKMQNHRISQVGKEPQRSFSPTYESLM